MNPNYFTETNILYAGVICLAAALVWACKVGRRNEKKILELQDVERRRISWIAELSVRLETEYEGNIKKDKIIVGILEDSNEKEICIQQKNREIKKLCEILNLKVPAYRVLKGEPAKLEAWLERLKGKKTTRP